MKRSGTMTVDDFSSLAKCMKAALVPFVQFMLHNSETLEKEGLDLRRLEGHLKELTELLDRGEIVEARQRHADFSITPHSVWLGRRKNEAVDPKRRRAISKLGGLAKSEKKSKAARSNGRKGGRPRAFHPELLSDELVKMARSMQLHPDQKSAEARQVLAQIRFLPIRVRYLVSRKLREAKIPFEKIGLSKNWNPSRPAKQSIAPTITAMVANALRDQDARL